MIRRLTPRSSALFTFGLLATVAAGCSSSESDSPVGTVAAATVAPVEADGATTSIVAVPAAATTVAAAAPATAAPAAPPPGDICAVLPDAATIDAALGETGGAPIDTGDATIEECQVNGETSSASFERTDAATGLALIDAYREQGTLVDFEDPDLPDAVAGANLVQTIIGDHSYAVQLITIDSITSPDTPEALAASAALLQAWLDVLGV